MAATPMPIPLHVVAPPLPRLGFALACGGHEHLLLAAVASIRKHCHPRAPVAVTFDGFEPPEDVAAQLDAARVRWARFTDWHGISAAWNSSIRMVLDEARGSDAIEAPPRSGLDYVCVFNDDALVAAGFDTDLVEFLDAHPEVRIACSLDRLTAWSVIPDIRVAKPREWGFDRLSAKTDEATVNRSYAPETFEAFAARVRASGSDGTWPPFLRCRMNGACFTLRRVAIQADGLFDEDFGPPGTHEDIDYWMRILSKHGPDAMGTVTCSYVHHIRAATIGSVPKPVAEDGIGANSRRFHAKWPKETWGDLWAWFSDPERGINALAMGGVEPELPRAPWWH